MEQLASKLLAPLCRSLLQQPSCNSEPAIFLQADLFCRLPTQFRAATFDNPPPSSGAPYFCRMKLHNITMIAVDFTQGAGFTDGNSASPFFDNVKSLRVSCNCCLVQVLQSRDPHRLAANSAA